MWASSRDVDASQTRSCSFVGRDLDLTTVEIERLGRDAILDGYLGEPQVGRFGQYYVAGVELAARVRLSGNSCLRNHKAGCDVPSGPPRSDDSCRRQRGHKFDDSAIDHLAGDIARHPQCRDNRTSVSWQNASLPTANPPDFVR